MSSSGKKGTSKKAANKVKYKRNITDVAIQKNNTYFTNKIFTIGATEGVMIAYITKPQIIKEQAFTYPIEHHLKENKKIMQQLQIGSITRRRCENGDNIQMPSTTGSRYPFHCFVGVVDDITQNTVQAQNIWAHNMCKYFNKLGSDKEIYKFNIRFIVCREDAKNDDNLLPVAKYLLNNSVIEIIKHVYSNVNVGELAGDDNIVKSFWGEDLFEVGKRLMLEQGQINA